MLLRSPGGRWVPGRSAHRARPAGRPTPSVARVSRAAAMPRGGSIADLSPWERWLELCARLDGFPRHLSIHVGGMLVTREPLVSIAPLERATMPGRVVIQWDKRDVEIAGSRQARPAGAPDAVLDRRGGPAGRRRLRRPAGPRRAARGPARGLRHDHGRRYRGRVPGRVTGPDAGAAQGAPGQARRPHRPGGHHPAGAHPGQRGPSLPAPPPGHRAGELSPPEPRSPSSRRPWA